MKYIYLNGPTKYLDDKCPWVFLVFVFFLANMTTTIMIGTTAIINVQRQRKLWVTLSC